MAIFGYCLFIPEKHTDLGELLWDDIRVAAVCARTGSLSAAARRLQLSVATVGRRLDRIESTLGQKLFHRHSGGLRQNPDASLILERAQEVSERVGDLMRAAVAGTDELEGEVTVSSLETLVTHMIAPRLTEFRRLYPRIRLVLRSTHRLVRLDRGAADVALRVVRPSAPRLVGRRLATFGYGLYATETYIDRCGRPDASDLSGHDVVMFDHGWDGLPEMEWLRERMGDQTPMVRVTTVAALRASVRAGAAVGLVPTFFARPDMVLLAGPDELPTRDIWLVIHEDLRDAAHVRAVVDFVAKAVADAVGARS